MTPTTPMQENPADQGHTAPDGTPFHHGVPLFARPYILSWHERQRYSVTVNPPRWKFWAKPETLKKRRWVRKSRSIGHDLADYLMQDGGLSRAEELILAMSQSSIDGIWGVMLERPPGGYSTNYIATTTN